MWAPAGENEAGDAAVTEGLMLSSTTAYNFSGGELITAFNNNPNLLNLRNDYSIWGEREGISGIKIPVHLRYAIDIKPKRYRRISVDYGTETNPGADFTVIKQYNEKHGTSIEGQNSYEFNSDNWDWREIIY
jgi:hypothetical protein